MTIFEYLSIAVSLVMALSLGKLCASIPHVFDPKRFDWVHASFFVSTVLFCIITWWNIWALHEFTEWNLLGFTLLLGSPLALYMATFALVSESPHEVTDWRAHFTLNARWFFLAWIVTTTIGQLRFAHFEPEVEYAVKDIVFFGVVYTAPIAGIAFTQRIPQMVLAVLFLTIGMFSFVSRMNIYSG